VQVRSLSVAEDLAVKLTARVARVLSDHWATPSLTAVGAVLEAVSADIGASHVEIQRLVQPGQPPTFPAESTWVTLARSGGLPAGELPAHATELPGLRRPLRLIAFAHDRTDTQHLPALAAAIERTASGYLKAMTSDLIYQTVERLSEADRVNAAWVAHGVQSPPTSQASEDTATRNALQAVATNLLSRLAAIQVDIYLTRSDGSPFHFRRVALAGENRAASPIEYDSREAATQGGLTAWAIANSQPLLVADLRTFEAGAAYYALKYPGASPRRRETCLDLGPTSSVIVAPICSSTGQHGFLRVLGVQSPGPEYLGEPILSPVMQVADLIGRYCSRWSALANLRRLPRQLQRINESPTNRLDYGAMRSRLMSVGLEAARELVPTALRASIRMVTEPTDAGDTLCLRFAAVHGPDWGDATHPSSPRNKTFPLAGPQQSIGRYVVERSETRAEDHTRRSDIERDPTFWDEKHLICAPIRCGDHVAGVIDVRSVQDHPFSQHDLAVTETVAALLGQHLRSIEHQQNFSHGFSDLAHQIENPLSKALRRIENLTLHGAPANANLEYRRIRGLLRKSSSVARNAEVFGQLASGEQIQVDDVLPHRLEEVDRILREYRDDYQLASDDNKHLAYRYDGKELRRALGERRLSVSMTVLNQALGCLLDNAEKYSRSDSLIAIRVAADSGSVCIAVTSEGLRIEADEALRLVERGYRGRAAEATTPEGYGLGLWIVDRLLSAHPGAQLAIRPTNSHELNRFELRFAIVGV
jgi:signal transduction histidine kinase